MSICLPTRGGTGFGSSVSSSPPIVGSVVSSSSSSSIIGSIAARFAASMLLLVALILFFVFIQSALMASAFLNPLSASFWSAVARLFLSGPTSVTASIFSMTVVPFSRSLICGSMKASYDVLSASAKLFPPYLEGSSFLSFSISASYSLFISVFIDSI